MPVSRKIVDLRKVLAERFSRPAIPPGAQIATGISALDEAAALQKGAITELISSRPSSGSAFLIHSLLAYAQRHRLFLGLIDGSDSFDPQSAVTNGLKFLLWIRCENARQAMQAA